jgi:hypothetical protein
VLSFTGERFILEKSEMFTSELLLEGESTIWEGFTEID